MSEKSDIRITRGELYAFVLQTLVAIAAVAAAAMMIAPLLRLHLSMALAMGIGSFAVALLVLPAQRVLIRTYYGREMPVRGSLVWALAATALVFGVWWLVQRL